MAVQVYWTVKDTKPKSTKTFSIDLPANTSALNAQAFLLTMSPIVKNLLNGGLVSAGVRYDVSVSGWTATAAAIADVQEKALFSFKTAIGNFTRKVTLPTFVETLFNPNSREVDQSDANVIAFVTAMTDGLDVTANGGNGTIQPTTSHSEDLATLESAVEAWG